MTNTVRIADKQKLFECDFPDCFRFYESLDKLAVHKYLVHNQPVGFDPAMMRGDMQGRIPMMGGFPMPVMGMSMMPVQNLPMMNPNFNMP